MPKLSTNTKICEIQSNSEAGGTDICLPWPLASKGDRKSLEVFIGTSAIAPAAKYLAVTIFPLQDPAGKRGPTSHFPVN